MAEWGRNATALLILFNLGVNVSIVLVNKYVFDIFEFKYATTLTALHFGCTAVGLDIMGKHLGVFKPKPVPVRDIAPIAIAYAFSIPLSNLSLAFNSVGFYQMVRRTPRLCRCDQQTPHALHAQIKILTTPFIALIQAMFLGQVFPRQVQLALTVVVAGVILASVNDFQLNFLGTAFALVNMCVTAYYQIALQARREALGLNAQQLLHNAMPLCTLVAVLLIPFFDNVGLITPNAASLLAYPWNTSVVFALAASCMLSVGVNYAIVALISATSAVTYNVVGHFKTVLILGASFAMLAYPLDGRNISGIAVALVGMALYTHAKLSAPAPVAAAQGGKGEAGAAAERAALVRDEAEEDTSSKSP